MFKHSSSLLVLAAVLMTAAACKDSTGPSGLNLSGTWVGGSLLPNPYTTTFELQQTGNNVSGLLRISGVLPFAGSAITGQVDPEDRTLAWVIGRGCEVWAGVLAVSADGQQLSGPVQIDRTGCVPAQSSGSGTMSVTRQ